MMTPPGISRRHFLGAASSAAFGAGLSSCTSPLPFDGDPRVLQRAHPDDIVVDSHCHVFNGRDIDIGAYALALTREKTGLAGYAILREVVAAYLVAMRELAPCITEELEKVQTLVAEVKHLPYHGTQRVNRVMKELVEVFSDRKLERERSPCAANINGTKASDLTNILFFGAKSFGTRRGKQIIERFDEALHDTRGLNGRPAKGDFTEQVRLAMRQVDKESGYLLAHFVNYRTVNAYELWRQFAHQFNPQNVDLFVAASVDMNSWLLASRKMSTGFEDKKHRSYMGLQVELMEQIAVLFGGDIMPMAGWCPRFAAEHTRGMFGRKFPHPLLTLEDAVMNRGHFGAKMYPPMGFRAYLNEELDRASSHAFVGMDDPHNIKRFPGGLGKYLDAELKGMFAWCQQKGVPVMAHTGPSHGAQIGYAERANPEYWRAVLDPASPENPRALGLNDLRVNLAHLGCWHPNSFWERITGGSDNARWGDLIMRMTGQYPHLYSDLAYMSAFESDRWKMKFDRAFTQWDSFPASSPKHRASRKMMYGSDWFVMAQADLFREDDKKMEQDPPDLSGRVGRTYHLRWAEFLRQQGAKHRYDPADILGHNAMRYLGMDTALGRERMDAFFDRHDMPPPVWRQKLDRLLAKGLV